MKKIVQWLNSHEGIELLRYRHRPPGGGPGTANPYTKVPGAYVIKHLASDKIYVGSSRNLAARLSTGKTSLAAGKHASKVLQRLFDADARVLYFVQSSATEEAAHELEQLLVNVCMSTGQLCNVGVLDVQRTRLGRPLTASHIEALKNASLGAKRSAESKEKMRQAHLGVPLSEEHCKKLSRVHKKRLSTKEGKKAHARGIQKISDRVSCEGVIYKSKSEAARQLGVHLSTICKRCKDLSNPNYFLVEQS